MKKILLSLLFVAGSYILNAQCGITFSVTSNPNLGPTSVVLTLNGTNAYPGFSVGINWGDGSDMSFGFEESWVHSYPANGTYQICLDFVAPTCAQTDYCNNYTVSQAPANLCPFTANYSVSGNTLTVNASGSGAGDPELSFHPDIMTYLSNPWDFSDFQFQNQHSGTFTHTYSPDPEGQTYMFCAGYADSNEPEACESNDYCSNVTFGNASASLENTTDFASVIQVFPVPSEDFINVHFSDAKEAENCHWTIYSSDGSVALEGQMHEQQLTILFPDNMAPGDYQFVLSSGNQGRTIRFIKI